MLISCAAMTRNKHEDEFRREKGHTIEAPQKQPTVLIAINTSILMGLMLNVCA